MAGQLQRLGDLASQLSTATPSARPAPPVGGSAIDASFLKTFTVWIVKLQAEVNALSVALGGSPDQVVTAAKAVITAASQASAALAREHPTRAGLQKAATLAGQGIASYVTAAQPLLELPAIGTIDGNCAVQPEFSVVTHEVEVTYDCDSAVQIRKRYYGSRDRVVASSGQLIAQGRQQLQQAAGALSAG